MDKDNKSENIWKSKVDELVDDDDVVWEWCLQYLYWPSKTVVTFNRFMLEHFALRGRNPVATAFQFGAAICTALYPFSFWKNVYGITLGSIFSVILGLIAYAILISSYVFFEAIQEEVASRSETFPEYDASSGQSFNELGVELSVLQEFIDSCGGRDALKGLTTTEVCNRFLMPLTEALGQSYCDQLRGSGCAHVKTANVFVSHAWRYEFLNAVDAIFLHLEGEESTAVIWFDLFSNNQHGLDEPPPFEWWCHTFLNAIKNINRTVMIIEPWDDPTPLTRAWCLWELFCTAKTKSRFEVAMCREQRLRLSQMISENSEVFYTVLSRIDAQRSTAWKDSDRERIFAAVEATIGFNNLNTLVISIFREWYITVLRDNLETNTTGLSDRVICEKQLRSLGCMYRDQGNYVAASKCFDELFKLSSRTCGMQSFESASARRLVGSVRILQGNFISGIGMLQACCEDYNSSTDPEILNEYMMTLLALGNALNDQKQYEEALQCFAIYEAKWNAVVKLDSETRLGFEDRNWECMLRRAETLFHIDNSDIYHIFRLFDSALSEIRRKYSEDHPFTLNATRRYANVLIAASDDVPLMEDVKTIDKAVSMLEMCVMKGDIRLGNDHPDIIGTRCDLGDAYFRSGNVGKAKDLYNYCAKLRRRALGKHHPDTLAVHYKSMSCSDYSRLLAISFLFAVGVFAVVGYASVAVMSGFMYGVGKYSGSELALVMACAPGVTSFPLMANFIFSKAQRRCALPFGLYSKLLYFNTISLMLLMVLSIYSLRKIVNRDNKNGKQYLYILYWYLGFVTCFGVVYLGCSWTFGLYHKYITRKDLLRTERVDQARYIFQQEQVSVSDTDNPLVCQG